MSKSSVDEETELAIRGFRNAVQTYLRTKAKPPSSNGSIPERIQDLLDHTAYCVRQLTSKRQSLENGLSYLQTELWPKILSKCQATPTGPTGHTQLLQHFLEQFLRMHDGLTLLVSGEVRHPADVAERKKQPPKFQSKLTEQYREDGYTRLYKAPEGYSGFGWDEFFDEKVGIKKRLLHALVKVSKNEANTEDTIWEDLLEKGGLALETLLDQHDLKRGQVERALKTDLKERVINDLKKLAKVTPSKNVNAVFFVLHDKMEALCDGEIKVYRRGDQFQLHDRDGLLPNGLSKENWSRIMKLPESTAKNALEVNSKSTNNRKAAIVNKSRRRRVILEESSDEEIGPSHPKKQLNKHSPQTPIAKPSASGLNVKVARKENTPPTPAQGTSLAVIKKQMGADGRALEAAREELEKEEALASKAAKIEEAEAMETTIEEGEANIRIKRKKLTRALGDTENMDILEIWDDCNGFRELLMVVGNQILHDCATYDDAQRRIKALLEAHAHFTEAGTVVDEQNKLLRKARAEGTFNAAEASYRSRNLLLMRGRATVNMGITSIELATQTKRKSHYNTVEAKQYLRTAAEELKKAKEYAESLRSRASTVFKNWSSDRLKTAEDAIRADELEALTTRSMGKVLWYQGSRNEAWQECKARAALFAGATKKFHEEGARDKAVHSALCNLATGCVLACMHIADLAYSSLEHLTPLGPIEERDLLLCYFKESLNKACDVIDSIETFFIKNPIEELTFDEFMDEEALMGKEAIQQIIRETEQEWLENQKAGTNRPIVVNSSDPERCPISLPRGELVSESLGLDKRPTRWFTVNEGSRRQKKKRSGPRPMYHENSGQLLSVLAPRERQGIISPSADGIEPQKYRPWGDELLPQITDEVTGKSVPKLEYPCVAPSMPHEIRAMLDAA
jgi:hypothetical protein